MTDLFLERDAVISTCQKYRYLLRRVWDYDLPRTLFVMLNPSTADAEIDDATIRRCMSFARSWNHGSIEVVNLFGLRATDPKELVRADNPIGPDNYCIAEAAVRRSDLCICAWGAHQIASRQARIMWEMIDRFKPAVYCLGLSKAKAPRHPLYLKRDSKPIVYRFRDSTA